MKHPATLFLPGALVLLAAAILSGPIQARAAVASPEPVATAPVSAQGQPAGEYVLTQAGASKETKPAPEAAPKAKKMRKMAPPPSAPAMERQDSKSIGIGEDFDRAGTKKLGGQPIRAKED